MYVPVQEFPATCRWVPDPYSDQMVPPPPPIVTREALEGAEQALLLMSCDQHTMVQAPEEGQVQAIPYSLEEAMLELP